LKDEENPKTESFERPKIEFILKAYKPTMMEKVKHLYNENDEN